MNNSYDGNKTGGFDVSAAEEEISDSECEKIKTCIVKKKKKRQTIAVKLPQSYFMIKMFFCITSSWYFLFFTYSHYFASTKVWTKKTP